ncbi:hypothetical protein NUU61_000528 [Penicillium alfredii]|uniref:Uncharacterized protein n=1 Tax=Penicillium alfredii TaxID=1506179 RepID=A0A9W9GA57_9EURO|nr:uncharacterized protein NUU61_000528 [Penicillium alfredii]KAJ5114769.1 hypothetical protein NUU61_000528 [Penicillium alfredii]
MAKPSDKRAAIREREASYIKAVDGVVQRIQCCATLSILSALSVPSLRAIGQVSHYYVGLGLLYEDLQGTVQDSGFLLELVPGHN